ncbi:integrase [Fulvimarina sp. 2208YS6-2-32]|uniref:Integrase n=1 Tax=Fulvimarina uroteuthidis TaxID=3098149 RepID=A0ABU5I1V8_9HYPH|nr:integrase [Fulvimarina sp. 2208YS6-2-32]MDY8109211.1 integrase [Fulvimarina sp. 2208YS6-2-32]
MAEFRAIIEAELDGSGSTQQREALALAKELRDASTKEHRDFVEMLIHDRASEIAGPPIDHGYDHDGEYAPEYEPKKESEARWFADLAFGKRVPIDFYHAKYLEQLDVKRRTLADAERSMKYLLEWCQREDIPPFLSDITERVAVRFMDELHTVASSSHPRTLNKYLSRLSLYWKWLKRRHEVERNVWDGVTLSLPNDKAGDRERPFTDAEVLRLLSGPASPELHDLMRIAALTGCRLDPIVCLRVRDCDGGNFVFKPQKREIEPRICPIHPDLREIVARRSHGKEPDAELFPEWPYPKTGDREKSFKASGHFLDYRRSIGVDEVVPGHRRSKVNFHSFRRWFATKAEQADQPPHIISAVIGHSNGRQGMTLRTYSSGPKIEQARRCVEAVHLPAQPTSN